MTENQNYKITFTLNEIKQLIIDNINHAHDNKWPGLQLCKIYTVWHDILNKFYIKNKTIQPTMADKLAFVILLSYPKHIIESFNDISDIKLFGDDLYIDNNDFNYHSQLCFNIEDVDEGEFDCICSYKRLQIIHIVENKHSGISLQVGSECIKKHGLISNKELKKFKETEKLLKDRRKEIKEGKPIGYYEEERKTKKKEKEINKLKKEEEMIQKKLKTRNFARCVNCEINIVGIKNNNLRICNTCKNNNYEESCLQIQTHQFNKCENCNNKFIDIKQNDLYLCKNCKTENKIIKCSWISCSTFIIVNINNNNVYCDDCEIKMIKCIDCKKNFIQNKYEDRCSICQYNYENKYVNKICVRCNEDMPIKEKEIWRMYCHECYKEIKDIINNPPKCKCNLDMSERTIKKEGKNKGRKALGCSKFPNGCNEFDML
jgi:hypothetical protein